MQKLTILTIPSIFFLVLLSIKAPSQIQSSTLSGSFIKTWNIIRMQNDSDIVSHIKDLGNNILEINVSALHSLGGSYKWDAVICSAQAGNFKFMIELSIIQLGLLLLIKN